MKPEQPEESSGDNPDQLLTVLEAAGILRLSRSKVYELMSKNELKFVQMGTRRRIKQLELRRYIDEHSCC